MAKIKFLVSNHSEIKKVEIEKETPANVWVKKSQLWEKSTDDSVIMLKKQTADGWHDFFDTLEEAKKHALEHQQTIVERGKKAAKIIAEIEAIKE